MRKIPTIYIRNPEDMARVLDQWIPGCEWVLAGEGVPTRKYDGTCCMFDGDIWWARREIKQGKQAPPSFIEVEHDVQTGKTVGWEPMENSPYAKWHRKCEQPTAVGTYELCGPKVNGNPEDFSEHVLIRHGDAEALDVPDVSHAALRGLFEAENIEGIVWHHPDGRMAKIKARDFGIKRREFIRS